MVDMHCSAELARDPLCIVLVSTNWYICWKALMSCTRVRSSQVMRVCVLRQAAGRLAWQWTAVDTAIHR